ncbi:hypothetical protein DPEC_G00033360 [Dallia pectoralis]|uniref:Uncharacterized protein n=1 Tax=Dallia pectoralis TaxID=75939 RepID=A0ACC2HDE5_DALPE|nr:hypothetical protein DPEC_G00033360 [Dallia pectoralis]
MSHTNSNIHMAPHLSLLIIFFISLRFSTDGYMHVETGGSIKIPFCYEKKYTDHVKYWCKGNTWAKCDYAARTDINISTKTWISDDIKERVLTVTMTDLSPVNSGYYCFAVEINQGPDIQLNWFHLTVTSTPGLYVEKQEVTGVEGGEVTVYCYYRDPGTIKWCPVCGDCVENSGTIVILVVLIAGVLVAWKMWRIHGDNTANNQPTKTAPDPFPDDDHATYSTIAIKKKTQQYSQTKATEPDENVIYSSLVL